MLDVIQDTYVPYGMGRLPAGLALNDPRITRVRLGPEPLRLNSEPLPAAAITDDSGDHIKRLAMLRRWLALGCGQYTPRSLAFIDAYLAFVAARLEANRVMLSDMLVPYKNVYAVADWTWSALRPLPRAWLPVENGRAMTDFAFWDGTKLISFAVNRRDVPGSVQDDELRNPEILFGARLSEPGLKIWLNQILPSSPFRRKSQLIDTNRS